MSAAPPPRGPDPQKTDRDPHCVFCDILAGEAEASFVYRAETVAAFMTIGAVNPGHVMVVPIRHSASLADLDPQLGAEMFKLAMEIAAAVRSSGLRCEGVNLLLNDGRPAFQSVFHTHLHVIPRYRGDGFGLIMPPHFSPRRSRPELDETAARIRAVLEGKV
jgi:histidine triad (HIT) family protein